MTTPPDLVIRNARIPGRPEPVAIAIRAGRIAEIAAAPEPGTAEYDAGGRVVLPGFVETHIHLDKSDLRSCCGAAAGTLSEAIAAVSRAKRGWTEEDVYRRGARTLEKAIVHGTTRMRTHVEIDPRIGLRGFRAVRRLKADYAWAIDLQLCAFPQEGLGNDPGADALLVEALEGGADLVGGCPYTDADPSGHMARIFELARQFDIDIDFHLDFDLDPTWMHLGEACRRTVEAGWQGRVAVGHATKLSAVGPERLADLAGLMRDSGVALTVLPATDLYLTGRSAVSDVPRGVAPAHRLKAAGVVCSVATNNVLNPFTPFGDCSLLRMANLYANVCHVPEAGFAECLAMITGDAAALMRLPDYGLRPGNAADLVILDADDPDLALAEIAPVRRVYKRGALTVDRPAARLIRPSATP